ncbi:MAG: hypothetical protein AB1640_18805 [bacterium]
MGIVTATSRFCYIQCDRASCSRKIYQHHEAVLRELARLTGWQDRDGSWLCPACVAKSADRSERQKPPIRARRKASGR